MAHIKTVRASEVAYLDSDVRLGGGRDDTEALQRVLDLAQQDGGVHLIMDGAAAVRGLKLYSGTTIECMNGDCGFFQLPQSNCPILSLATPNRREIQTRNITLIGGTYNQDCLNQLHHTKHEWVYALCFYGVENLVMRDMTILDFSTFCVTIGNFRRVTIENVWVDLPHRVHARNQDGFHFWGPGQFLTLRNVGGKVGDDFMNIGPDEQDHVSSITDVLVDGVFLDDADQAIRILSRGSGLIDRCTIRNVQGTYRSFGFYINSWFPDRTAGNFGDILIENVHLTHTAPNYDYRPPVLFSVGGDIRSLTLKNIRHSEPIDNRPLLEVGLPFYETTPASVASYVYPAGHAPKLRNLIIDGWTVLENGQSENLDQIVVYGPVGNMVISNVLSVKEEGAPRSGNLVKLEPCGEVDALVMRNITANQLLDTVCGKARVKTLVQSELLIR